ncbi:hypothetical protein [Pseudomonas sp. RW405]|uniref:hypothetical protein n=1 Tax=Pseudomonas sp. RW405 TaxID=2202652 RepID=UPI0011B553D5|nr:hypothetical protein [Pseudomonas sp. RW405]
MTVDSVLAWFETHEWLVAWLAFLALPVVWIARKFSRFFSRVISQRKIIRSGAAAVEEASSKLLKLATAANNAGRQERRDIAALAEGHLESIRAIEAASEDSTCKTELANAAEGVSAFQRAVLNWHGEDDCDNTQRDAGMAAIERVKLSAENLKNLL